MVVPDFLTADITCFKFSFILKGKYPEIIFESAPVPNALVNSGSVSETI